eukprot:GHVT01073551.1.p1 GENE.GHVT01073551.1~~GHVT01073551.1.p1  ORF type:complete len:867 (+),score=166.86 GHVT01073551.1:1062-3662(+)
MMARSMAKDVYSTLFDFSVVKVNELIKFSEEKKWIGILDIYGFEFFENNSMEQYLINYANERLQQFFIQQVFQAEKAEYEAEGIDHSMIVYSDNAIVLEVFDKPKAGIFSFLEEACLIASGTAESFTSTCHKNIKNEHYCQPKGDARMKFEVIHTAAPVTYNAQDFIIKNKHKLPNSMIEMFQKANNSCVREGFQAVELPDTKSMKGKFVGSKFQKSMASLMTTLKSSSAHFIRCIKPNQVKKPQVFEADGTLGQLVSLSILESVAIIHKGFAYRASFDDFARDNSVLMKVLGGDVDSSDTKKASFQLLDKVGISKDQYQLGATKLFLRKDAWLQLEKELKNIMFKIKPFIVKLQCIYRAWKNKREVDLHVGRVKLLQTLVRRYVVRSKELGKLANIRLFSGTLFFMKAANVVERQNAAALKIQKIYRGYRARKQTGKERRQKRGRAILAAFIRFAYAKKVAHRFVLRFSRARRLRAAVRLQCMWRRHAAQKKLRTLRADKILSRMAIKIQSRWRGYAARVRFALLKHYKPYAVIIQAHWRGYRWRKSAQFKKISSVFQRIKVRRLEDESIRLAQAALRKFFVQAKLQLLTQATYTIQKYSTAKLLKFHFVRLLAAAQRIQAWWRGQLVRRIVLEEKLKILLASQEGQARRQSIEECEVATKLIKETLQYGGPSEGWLHLLHVAVAVPSLSNLFPSGFARWLWSVHEMIASGYGVSSSSSSSSSSFSSSFSFSACSSVSSRAYPPHLSDIQFGGFHALALSSDGRCFAMDSKGAGQLGGVRVQPSVPVCIPLPHAVTVVQCGVRHSLVLTVDQSVHAWGDNNLSGCPLHSQSNAQNSINHFESQATPNTHTTIPPTPHFAAAAAEN